MVLDRTVSQAPLPATDTTANEYDSADFGWLELWIEYLGYASARGEDADAALSRFRRNQDARRTGRCWNTDLLAAKRPTRIRAPRFGARARGVATGVLLQSCRQHDLAGTDSGREMVSGSARTQDDPRCRDPRRSADTGAGPAQRPQWRRG